MNQDKLKEITSKLRDEVSAKPKRMKIKTLMKCFDYDRRTEESATKITEILAEIGVIIRPSIMKIEGEWKLKLDDQIYLSSREKEEGYEIVESSGPPDDWNSDGLFDNFEKRDDKYYNNEREVESKFLIPLLGRLGYNENDRFDGMGLNTQHGSKKTIIYVDCALFNKILLPGQVLLIAETKKHFNDKDCKIQQARDQVKSYAMWGNCHYGLITDGKILEVIKLFAPTTTKELIFQCDQKTLKSKFDELYKKISKKSLTEHYNKLMENR